MDASQITKLREKQQTQYINRNKCNDSSTLIWANQIRSSTYISGSNVQTCDGTVQNTPVPTQAAISQNGLRQYGGQGKQMTLVTGSSQQYPSVFGGALGSASQVFSSEAILLQKAGLQACGTSDSQKPIGIVLPTCFCGTNGVTPTNPLPPVNDMSNPYLPAFDTHYKYKHEPFPCVDENKKHFVAKCCTK